MKTLVFKIDTLSLVWTLCFFGMENTRTILAGELLKRKTKRKSYSLRAFAKYLEVSPTHLSLMLNGKKNLTLRLAKQIIEKLDLPPSDREEIYNDIIPQSGPLIRNELTEEQFSPLKEWYYYAILSLASLKSNVATGGWVAKRLQIDHATATDAFLRLQNLGYIKVENGRFRQCTKPLSFSSSVPSATIRSYHRKNLEIAAEKLESIPLAKRYFSSITMAVDPTRIRKIGKLIESFKDAVSNELERNDKTEVYTLAIQLFPLTECEE